MRPSMEKKLYTISTTVTVINCAMNYELLGLTDLEIG